MPLAWVRFLPWALTAVTVGLNVTAAPPHPAPRVGHGALPLLWVACSEIAAHVYRVLIGEATGRRMERVRRSRWLLAPASTARLWRQMILWEETAYRRGLVRERARQLARADLRDAYGWNWRRKVARRQRVLLRFGELAPVDLATSLAAAPDRAPVLLGDNLPAPRHDRVAEDLPGDSSALTWESGAGAKLSPVQEGPKDMLAAVPGSPSDVEGSGGGRDAIAPAGDSSEAGDRNGGQDLATGLEAGDSPQLPGDPGSGDRKPAARTGGKRRKRRPMNEWVELAAPVFHEEFRRLKRQPTGEEFAEAIALAGLGPVSPSTAKNIRTEILDRTDLPILT
jgi:hypothetical protein